MLNLNWIGEFLKWLGYTPDSDSKTKVWDDGEG